MENKQKLVDEFNTISKIGVLPKEIPSFVLKNINSNFSIREYQKEAINRFIFFTEQYPDKKLPVHLLFQMATGSGKTLLMAMNILYLYSKGYRNFIFFVNSNNIIKKTIDNFLNKSSIKYLFAEKVIFNDKEIEIKKVDNFEAVNNDNINIVFTTVQGLHSKLNNTQENSLTYEDFSNIKIVFLSDEAHHINTLTKKKLGVDESAEVNSWENTVSKILSGNEKNVMLEYTATVELSHQAVSQKYFDKIIYQYKLREFREDKFSKEVQILQSDLVLKDRILQAIILSQYRRKVAEKNKIFLKPVILFKSKQVKDSQELEQTFYKIIKNLGASDIIKIKNNNKDGVIKNAFNFFDNNKITDINLIKELQSDFSQEKCLIINNQDDSEEKQLIVNNLEDYNNQIRVVFTTNMLNEGWDVLNLFDIVRLYETRDAKSGKGGQTTISEAQLIGRGARYFPFKIKEDQERFKRKFDNDSDNELRILEELHYHSKQDSRYIAELKNELVNTGIMADNKIQLNLLVKDDIKKTIFWKSGLIFLNKKIPKDNKDVKSLKDLIKDSLFKYRIKTGQVSEMAIFEQEQTSKTEEIFSKNIKISQFGKSIMRSAIDRIDFYYFSNISRYLPNIKSVDDFLISPNYCGQIEIELQGKKESLENLSKQEQFEISLSVFNELAGKIQTNNSDFIGTKEFFGQNVKILITDKTIETLKIDSDKEYGKAMSETMDDELKMDLGTKDWYIYNENYGTSEEKYLIKFISNAIDELKNKYKEVYLLRNENLFKIYRFSDAKAIEPDFVLFLKDKNKILSYQLFIEPKGSHLVKTDQWKEEFLKEIEKEYKIDNLFDSDKYRLIGLPFFNNSDKKQEFETEFKDKLKV